MSSSWRAVAPERRPSVGSPFSVAIGDHELLWAAYYGTSQRWTRKAPPDPFAGVGPYSWTGGGLRLGRLPHDEPDRALLAGPPAMEASGDDSVLYCATIARDLYLMRPPVGPVLEVWMGPLTLFEGEATVVMDVHGQGDERIPHLNVFGKPEREGLRQLLVTISLHTSQGRTVRGYPNGGGSGSPWGNTGAHCWSLPVTFTGLDELGPIDGEVPGTLAWLGIDHLSLDFGGSTRRAQ